MWILYQRNYLNYLNRKIRNKITISLLQQTCEFRGSTSEIFQQQRQVSRHQMWMQDQVGERLTMSWFESFELREEFEEVCIKWLTKIAPLWRLNFYSLSFDTSFDLPFASHCLQSQATTTTATTTATCFKDLSVERFGSRTDYQTSQHFIYKKSCVKSQAL